MDVSKAWKKERREVATFMRRLYKQKLTTTSGGNISLKLSDSVIAITPSGTDKGRMKWKEVGLLDISGENLTPGLKPSMEAEMHLSIYRINEEVKAIVHAHPVFASSFTATGSRIRTDLTAEACAILGEPMKVPYAVMGSTLLAEKVSLFSNRSGILLLENHGILATGFSLLQAFDKVEVLENAAMMTVITTLTGKRRPLSQARINEINNLFRQ